MSGSAKTTMTISFYPAGKLPGPLAKIAKAQSFEVTKGLVAVRTIVASPPRYEFDEVGSTPAQIKAYYEKLAREDNANLDEVAKQTLSGE
jgi:hypothetical protein